MRAEAIKRRLEPQVLESDSEDDESEGQKQLNDDDEYTVESTGATVTTLNAKGLLYRYCSKLPADKWGSYLSKSQTWHFMPRYEIAVCDMNPGKSF